MYLTVLQMIERGGFSDFVIYAGASGLRTREVKTVCVIDTVDIEGWLFGGEFLLTSGYIFRDDPELLGDVIEASSRKGAAALGVKIGRYIDRIPQETLRIADRLSFPLIGVPFHYAHTDIINPAIITIADKKSEMMEISEEIRMQFFDRLLDGGSADSILSLLRDHIRRDVMFLNASTGERRILSDSAEFSQAAGETPLSFLMDHFPHEVILACPRQPASVPEKPGGYLFIDLPTSDEKSSAALAHAKSALQLHLRWESERWRIERGRESQFVHDMLYKRFRQGSEIKSRGLSLGWNLEGRHAVVLVSVDRARSARNEPEEPHAGAYGIFRLMMREIQPDGVPHAPLEDGMAFIMKAPPEEWGAIKSAIREKFMTSRRMVRNKTGLHLVIGVGAPVDDLMTCDKSFREAKRVVAMEKNSDDQTYPCFWEDMGVYRLLAPIHDTREARDFVSEHLGALMERGENSQARDSLLQTLFCVIRNNWQLKPVSSSMNLHYNTVKYRYRKIGEILGMDLESQDVRIGLALAMELHTLNRTRGGEWDGR
jgi:purine catabolism regulator